MRVRPSPGSARAADRRKTGIRLRREITIIVAIEVLCQVACAVLRSYQNLNRNPPQYIYQSTRLGETRTKKYFSYPWGHIWGRFFGKNRRKTALLNFDPS